MLFRKMTKIKSLKILEIILLSVLLFSAISFMFFFFPPRLFSFIDFNEIKIGFPLYFFHEYRIADREIASKWTIWALLIDYMLCLFFAIIFYKNLRFKNFKKINLFKSIFIGSIYSVFISSGLSFIGLIKTAILQNDQYQIGLPFTFYSQFWLSGNYFPNHGSNPKYFLLDIFLIWLLSISIILLYSKPGKKIENPITVCDKNL